MSASRLFVDDNVPSLGGPMAVVSMTGGTITVGDLAIPTNYGLNGLNGHFQLDAGVVTVNNASTGGKQNQPSGFRLANGFGEDVNALNSVTGTMDIEAGTMLLMGDASALVQDYINQGVLTGYGNPAWVRYDFNMTNPGFTTVRAVPEPSTIALLLCGMAAGAVCLRRHRGRACASRNERELN